MELLKVLKKLKKTPPPTVRFYIVVYRASSSKIVRVTGPYNSPTAKGLQGEIEDRTSHKYYTKIKETINFNGRWCSQIKGRIPYPIECQWSKKLFANTECRSCERQVKWKEWKDGIWDKIKYKVHNGLDLTKEIPPAVKETKEIKKSKKSSKVKLHKSV